MKDMTMRKAITLVGLITAVATAAPAHAQGPIPVPAAAAQPAPPAPVPEAVVVPVEAAPPAPPRRRLHVGAVFLPMALGEFSAVYGGMPITADAGLAPGFALSVGYEVIPGLSVGLSPQMLFNVGTKEDPTGGGQPVVMAREIDVMARIAYAYPIAEGIRIFAELLPGYSLILPELGDPAKGFVIAGGLGADLVLTERAFLTLAGGYQKGFQTRVDDRGVATDVRTEYIRIALGGGWRF